MVKYIVEDYCLKDTFNRRAEERLKNFKSMVVTFGPTNTTAPFDCLYVFFWFGGVLMSPVKPDLTQAHVTLQYRIDLRNLEIVSETRDNERQSFSWGDRLCFTAYRVDEFHYTQAMPRALIVVPCAEATLPAMYDKEHCVGKVKTYSVKYYVAPRTKRSKDKTVEKVTIRTDNTSFVVERSAARFNNRLVAIEHPRHDDKELAEYNPYRWVVANSQIMRKFYLCKVQATIDSGWPVTFFCGKDKLCFSIAWKKCTTPECSGKVFGTDDLCNWCKRQRAIDNDDDYYDNYYYHYDDYW